MRRSAVALFGVAGQLGFQGHGLAHDAGGLLEGGGRLGLFPGVVAGQGSLGVLHGQALGDLGDPRQGGSVSSGHMFCIQHRTNREHFEAEVKKKAGLSTSPVGRTGEVGI
jgi:hypothetical protein